jgi:hypothetical protein
MEVIAQRLDDILDSLRPLTVDWKDATAHRVIDRLKCLPVKKAYTVEDLRALLDGNFEDGILVCRLFLGLSKDQFVSVLRDMRGDAGIGVKSYKADRTGFIGDLLSTGILEAMAVETGRKTHWTDVLVERLRSGRGSAISGQKRGRFRRSNCQEGFRRNVPAPLHLHRPTRPNVISLFPRRAPPAF